MAIRMTDGAASKITVVDNAFIDHYMASASGEYVKVYLYLLRHQSEQIGIEDIAGGLNHTEADVRRALAYWERAGLLSIGEPKASVQPCPQKAEQPQAEVRPSGSYGADDLNRLSGDDAFAELLYIAQKYMNKVFSQRECQIFAYLYDGLHMRPELLEYLVEYCVQLGHTNIRYIETVALNWHQRGIATVDSARNYAGSYSKDSFAVMKAFGLTDRKPAPAEQQIIEKWFQEWGFSRELVLEACRRTIEAIHTPSFKYADTILGDWKKANVHTADDVQRLDRERSRRRIEDKEQQGGQNIGRTVSKPSAGRRGGNQFHNFEQRDVDYDALILEQLRQK